MLINTIIKPDDFHLHLREGDLLKTVLPYTEDNFARALVMPNTSDPITTVEKAKKYYQEIKALCITRFTPLMSLYFTKNLKAEEIKKAKDSGIVKAVKLYPQGATTNSEFGVNNIEEYDEVFQAMSDHKIPLLIHGEVTSLEIDIFDREKAFIDQVLVKLITKFPNLKIVLEHITTKYAVDFILQSSDKLAATITVHHLYLNRNDLLVGGIKPHYYCLPILKQEEDRLALVRASTSGNKKFFAGTDSAPHLKSKKESACGCAGIFTSTHAVSWYAEIFDQNNALNHLESFLSKNGADFYGLPYNEETINLKKEDRHIEIIKTITTSSGEDLIPFIKDTKWTISD